MVPKWLLNKYIADDNKESSRNHATFALPIFAPSSHILLYVYVYSICILNWNCAVSWWRCYWYSSAFLRFIDQIILFPIEIPTNNDHEMIAVILWNQIWQVLVLEIPLTSNLVCIWSAHFVWISLVSSNYLAKPCHFVWGVSNNNNKANKQQ